MTKLYPMSSQCNSHMTASVNFSSKKAGIHPLILFPMLPASCCLKCGYNHWNSILAQEGMSLTLRMRDQQTGGSLRT